MSYGSNTNWGDGIALCTVEAGRLYLQDLREEGALIDAAQCARAALRNWHKDHDGEADFMECGYRTAREAAEQYIKADDFYHEDLIIRDYALDIMERELKNYAGVR